MTLTTMQDIALAGKIVLIREDFNVPINEDGDITNVARILAALPTIKKALAAGAAVMLLSHLGRPKEGLFDEKFSLKPVAACLSDLLGRPVPLIKNWLDGVDVQPGQVVLCENVRFNLGEKANDETLAKKMAALGDVIVMDAFAAAHRPQASTYGIAQYIPTVCAGPLLIDELQSLAKGLEQPDKPLLAIVGGSKVSTKLAVLRNLLEEVDQLIVGGGIANTFIAAAGFSVGKSLYEPDLVNEAKALIIAATRKGAKIPIPTDVVVATSFDKNALATVKPIENVTEDELILDVGPETSNAYAKLVAQAKTIIWNGPLGVFEFPQFAKGTESLARAIADGNAFSLAGGGDTIAAIDQVGVRESISYISTGGGAFLNVAEGKALPTVTILEQRANEQMSYE